MYLRIVHLISFACVFFFQLNGQETKLRAYLDTKQFFAPGTGHYLEIYFQYTGYSVNYLPLNGGLQGELAVAIEISDGEKVITSDAYRLQTPFMKDSIVEDFYDLRRYNIQPGNYFLKIALQDLNSKKEAVKTSQPLTILNLSDSIGFSDVQCIEFAKRSEENSPFVKSGYHMIPRLSTFFPSELSSIPVYFEIYNSNQLKDSVFGLKQRIINTSTGQEIEEMTAYSKLSRADVVPVLKNVNISNLTTGKYELNYTLISREMKEIGSASYLFERSNDVEQSWDITNIVLDPAFQASIPEDSVSYYLESLIPISKPAEIKNIISILKSKNSELQRKHIQLFWNKTSPISTYDTWIKYKGQVLLVEKLYANNFQEGFETDRGRVYLQYGAPTNIIQREVSSTEYPYEIWQYNKIGKFSNRRFIFYNPDLVNNAYRLIHSDMLGELKNPGWPQILSSRNTNKGNVDDPNMNMQDYWGGDSRDFFRQY